MEKILVTGGGGYVGTILCERLLEENYKVICLDRFFFGLEKIKHLLPNDNFSYVQDDIRRFDKKILKDVFCVIDLASLSNDPAGEIDASKTLEINYKGRVRVANLSKSMGVKKYFLASSCSLYGFNKEICNENSKINPLTTYAKASALAEKEILELGNKDFCCTSFRFATIYGLSKRMRFDLVVNTMTLSLYQNHLISVNGGGHQKRPLIDVLDASEAYLLGIKSHNDSLNKQIINVGSNKQNYKMIDLANEIRNVIGEECKIISKGDPDFRSYHVDFSKIKELINFIPSYTPSESSKEIFDELKNKSLDHGIKTRTKDWYLELIKKGKFD